jgi:hypothetical protein
MPARRLQSNRYHFRGPMIGVASLGMLGAAGAEQGERVSQRGGVPFHGSWDLAAGRRMRYEGVSHDAVRRRCPSPLALRTS